MSCGCNYPPDPGPHVLLVVIDTLRADHLASYGYSRNTDPALGSFLDESVLFENAYSPSSWTTPATASILTGLFPARHRSSFRGAALSEEALTLAELLTAAGWNSAGFSHNHNVSHKTSFHQGFAHFASFEGKATGYPDVSRMVDEVEDWLDDQRPGRKFLFLQPMNVHGPYKVPPSHQKDLLGRNPDPTFVYYKQPMRGILKQGDLAARELVGPAYLGSLVDQYDTAIRYLTDQLTQVFALLQERGIWEDTLVIVTSDHGEEFFEHGGFSHGYSLHQELLHVPMIIKLPGGSEPRRVQEWVSNMDLLPTVLDVLRLPLPEVLDGRSLLPLLKQERPEEPPQSRPRYFDIRWDKRCIASAILEWPWKLIRVQSNYEGLSNQDLLFHLEKDPGETRNLATDHKDLVQEMGRRLSQAMARFDLEGLPEPENVEHLMDPAVLQALGYADEN